MNRIATLLALKPIMYGLAGMILSGLTFPLTGVTVVRHNLISMRYMLMHTVILGGVLSIVLDLPLLCVVIPINLLFVLLIGFINGKGYELSNASSVMMVFTIGLASLLSHVCKVPAKDTLEILWGSPFTLTKTDLLIIVLLGIAIILYISTCFRQISAVFFDTDIAQSQGINVKRHNSIMMLFTSLVISVAMKELGALLIDALLILPAVSVSKDTDSLKKVFVKSSVTGLLLSVSGYFSSLLFNVPVSGLIALYAAAWLCLKNCRIRKYILILFAMILTCASVYALPSKEHNLPEKNRYVASTSWVASICQIAGIDDMTIIAPSDMKHPPEYEISPDDVYTVANAQLFMHAGYEVMMDTIGKSSEINPDKVIKVKTTNTLENITDMVRSVSEKAGTQEEAEIRLKRFTDTINKARENLKSSGISGIEMFVNVNQAEFARDLGLNVAATFGPGPLSADQLALCAEKHFKIIIDNSHNPVSSPIAFVSPDSRIIEWRNFPDTICEDSLRNLIEENISMLLP